MAESVNDVAEFPLERGKGGRPYELCRKEGFQYDLAQMCFGRGRL